MVEKMSPKEILYQGCNDIVAQFPDFKATQKSRVLKKLSADKRFSCEIHFETSRYNYGGNAEIRPLILIKYKQTQDTIICCNIGYLTARQEYQTWNLGGASYQYTVKEICEQITTYILPIFEIFDNADNAIEFLLMHGTKFNKYIKDISISPFNFILDYGGKQKAEIFLNHFVQNCSYKGEFYRAYEHLIKLPQEEIKTITYDFIGEDILKTAILNEIELKKI